MLELFWSIYVHFYIPQGNFEVLKLQYFMFLYVLSFPEPSLTSRMEVFAENHYLFYQKDSFRMFDWVLNKPLIAITVGQLL